MFRVLQKSVTTYKVPFAAYSSINHASTLTGLSSFTILLSKNGGAFGAASGSIAEVGSGVYTFDPAAGDLDTEGDSIIAYALPS